MDIKDVPYRRNDRQELLRIWCTKEPEGVGVSREALDPKPCYDYLPHTSTVVHGAVDLYPMIMRPKKKDCDCPTMRKDPSFNTRLPTMTTITKGTVLQDTISIDFILIFLLWM